MKSLSREAKYFAHDDAPIPRMGRASYYRHVQDTIGNRGCADQHFEPCATKEPLDVQMNGPRPATPCRGEQPLAMPALAIPPREAARNSARA